MPGADPIAQERGTTQGRCRGRSGRHDERLGSCRTDRLAAWNLRGWLPRKVMVLLTRSSSTRPRAVEFADHHLSDGSCRRRSARRRRC